MRHSSNYSSSDNEQEDLAEINMIPLIDVMLVLLIVFMIAAPLSLSGFKVNLPTAKGEQQALNETKIILSIDEKGSYYIDKTKVDENQVEDKLRSIYSLRDNKDLFINADKAVRYGLVIGAMSKAKNAGAQKIAMLTTPTEQAPVPSIESQLPQPSAQPSAQPSSQLLEQQSQPQQP